MLLQCAIYPTTVTGKNGKAKMFLLSSSFKLHSFHLSGEKIFAYTIFRLHILFSLFFLFICCPVVSNSIKIS